MHCFEVEADEVVHMFNLCVTCEFLVRASLSGLRKLALFRVSLEGSKQPF